MIVEKSYIVAEICRTAEANGGTPLGKRRFQTETGIKEADWLGKYWSRWSDAVSEAGLQPNRLTAAYDDAFLLERLAALVQELDHFPVRAELRLRARLDQSFPSPNTFARFGPQPELASRLLAFCQEWSGGDLGRVAEICTPLAGAGGAVERPSATTTEFGSVYLLKSGRYYKIGRSNAAGRRERELAIQLPERAKLVHQIRTDDPAGIELYWHRRFETKRLNGEWFALTAGDVAAFNRRKFM